MAVVRIAAVLVATLVAPQSTWSRTYVVKSAQRSWTQAGKRLYFHARRPRRRLPLVRLRSGPGFIVTNPARAWGTRLAIYRVNLVMGRYHAQFPDADPVEIGDLSKRGGGPLPNHMTHMRGLDVDVPLILESPRSAGGPPRLDRQRTWFLLREFVRSCDVDYVFVDHRIQAALFEYAVSEQRLTPADLAPLLQYPRPSTSSAGIVRHWPNHHDHLHIRFRREHASLLPIARRYCEHGR